MMHVELCTPTMMVLQRSIDKIVAQGTHGSFCILPRHTDFLAVLVPGIVMLTEQNHEKLFACDHGLLVKQQQQVWISVDRAIEGNDLETLKDDVRAQFETYSESEKTCHAAVANLEATFLRRFLTLQRESDA